MSNKSNIDLSYNGRLAKIEEQAEEIERLKNALELHIAAEDKGWRLYNDSLKEIEQLEKLVKKAFEEGWEHKDKDLTTIENGWYESDAQKSLKEK